MHMKKYKLIKVPKKFIFKEDYKEFRKGEVYKFISTDDGEDWFNYESSQYKITFDGWYLAGIIKKKVIVILS